MGNEDYSEGEDDMVGNESNWCFSKHSENENEMFNMLKICVLQNIVSKVC